MVVVVVYFVAVVSIGLYVSGLILPPRLPSHQLKVIRLIKRNIFVYIRIYTQTQTHTHTYTHPYIYNNDLILI